MAIQISLVNNSICLPLDDGAFHVYMAVPFSLIAHFDPSIIQYRPRRCWFAALFGQGRSPGGKAAELALFRLRTISQQLSGLLFGREEAVKYVVASCDADDWEHLGSSNFHWTFFLGAEDNDDARVLVFKANEKLVQGSIQFSGEELGEKEKAAWKAGWRNLVKTCERLDSYSTPLEREMWDKNSVLHRQLQDKMPTSLDEKESFESSCHKG